MRDQICLDCLYCGGKANLEQPQLWIPCYNRWVWWTTAPSEVCVILYLAVESFPHVAKMPELWGKLWSGPPTTVWMVFTVISWETDMQVFLCHNQPCRSLLLSWIATESQWYGASIVQRLPIFSAIGVWLLFCWLWMLVVSKTTDVLISGPCAKA